MDTNKRKHSHNFTPILENYIAISYIRRHFRNQLYEQEKDHNTKKSHEEKTKYLCPCFQDNTIECLTRRRSRWVIRMLRVLRDVGENSGLPELERNS